MVGLSKEQIGKLPNTIIGIGKTNSVTELAELYSIADVFVNPTYEDNYPTTNIEAIACGTPVITFKTGGSVESVPTCNVVEKGDIGKAAKIIKAKKYQISTAVTDKDAKLKEYLELYG